MKHHQILYDDENFLNEKWLKVRLYLSKQKPWATVDQWFVITSILNPICNYFEMIVCGIQWLKNCDLTQKNRLKVEIDCESYAIANQIE